MNRAFVFAAALAAPTLAPRAAQAVDRFEIQVYEDDVNRPGQFGLELHTNYTIDGRTTPEYAGQVPPNHVGRLTLEPALGLTDWLELGGYVQSYLAPEVGAQYGGFKLRAKMVVPESAHLPLMLGLNVEIGRVPHRVEEHGWANEFRPIIGWKNDWVLAVVNPIFGYALTGSERFKPDFEPAGKLAVNTQLGFALGAEYYAGLGRFDQDLAPVSSQEHLLFGVFDLTPPAGSEPSPSGDWELNVGVGRALTEATGPQWIVKSIFGRAF